jgi:hypothetical protein
MGVNMSEADFHAAVERKPHLFEELMAAELSPMKTRKDWSQLHAIYVFYESDGQPCHVGRVRRQII